MNCRWADSNRGGPNALSHWVVEALRHALAKSLDGGMYLHSRRFRLTRAEAGSYRAARAAEVSPPSTEKKEGFCENTTGHYSLRSIITLTLEREFYAERLMRRHGYRSVRKPKRVYPVSGRQRLEYKHLFNAGRSKLG